MPSISYEFSNNYAHILISMQANEPEKIYEELKKEIKKQKEETIKEEEFNRIKKMIYGEYVKEYNDVTEIARMFLSDYFKGINTFDYLEQIGSINLNYVNQILKEVFDETKMCLSIIRN